MNQITEKQQENLQDKIFEKLIENHEIGLGERGECRDEAKRIVSEWLKSEGIKINNTELDATGKERNILRIGIIWQTDDIIMRTTDMGYPTLSDEVANKILEDIERSKNCEYGITWQTIEDAIYSYHYDNGIRKVNDKRNSAPVEVRLEICKLTIWLDDSGEMFVNIDGDDHATTPAEMFDWESYQDKLTEEDCKLVWNTFKYDISEYANNAG